MSTMGELGHSHTHFNYSTFDGLAVRTYYGQLLTMDPIVNKAQKISFVEKRPK